ncbi:MAG: hypothetical protein GYA77_06080 [Candidatus Cloacimonetes bacterium]|nr:hypothetical protein [Candidatus Cloacimonadota bacterium]
MKKLALLSILFCALSFLGAADEEFHAGDQSVFMLPTAYTMPKGSCAVTVYEAVILQFAYAPIDRLHLSAGMVVLPFNYNLDMAETITAGAKYNYYRGKSMASAVWGSCTYRPKLLTLGNVLSFGSNGGKGVGSVHLMGMLVGDIESENLRGILGTGGILHLFKRVNGMMDFLYYVPINLVGEPGEFFGVKDHNYALLNAGIRLKGKRGSVDWGGLGSVGKVVKSKKLQLLPFVKVTFMF